MIHLSTAKPNTRGNGCAMMPTVASVALGFILTFVSPTISASDSIRGDEMNDIKCTIEKTPTSYGYNLRGVVWSDSGGSGSYRLSVTRQGANGRSSMIQEGLFALEKGEKQMLSTVSISADAGDYVSASLKIRSSDQELCTAEL